MSGQYYINMKRYDYYCNETSRNTNKIIKLELVESCEIDSGGCDKCNKIF